MILFGARNFGRHLLLSYFDCLNELTNSNILVLQHRQFLNLLGER